MGVELRRRENRSAEGAEGEGFGSVESLVSYSFLFDWLVYTQLTM